MATKAPRRVLKPVLEIKPLAPSVEESVEVRRWKRFQNPVVAKQLAPVTHIAFSPVDPYEYAVCSSTRLQIFDPDTNEVKKSYTQFKNDVYGVTYRKDGNLIAAGGKEGIVRIYNPSSGGLLRQMKAHKSPIRVCKFSFAESQIFTGSHDTTSKLWDVGTGTVISTFDGHSDYVWCGATNPSTPNVWVTGGYDHKINIWDVRDNNVKFTLDNQSPVEDLLIFPSGSVVVTAGKNEIKIWDLLGGGRLLDSISTHSKTITCLALNFDGTRLLSGGLDHLVKVYDVTSYEPVFTIPYSSPIMSLAIAPNDSHLVVGMSDSTLNIKTKRLEMAERSSQREMQEGLRGGTYMYFLRGKNDQAHKEDLRTQSESKNRIKGYDYLLRKFRYQDSLDAVLAKNIPPGVTISMLDELITRKALDSALRARNEVTLLPILEFTTKHIKTTEFSHTLVKVANKILDIYASIFGSSPKVDQQFKELKKAIEEEVLQQKQLLALIGSLDLLFATSNLVRNDESYEDVDSQTNNDESKEDNK